MGEYELKEIADLILKIIEKNPNLKEIKFYSCESAVNKNTYSDQFKKMQRTIKGVCNKSTKKTRVMEFYIGESSFKKYQKCINEDKLEEVSNIQIIMNTIYQNLKIQKNKNMRTLLFQGLNGVGWMTSQNPKMRTFDQKFLKESQNTSTEEKEIEFGNKHVETKKSVDKLAYIFKF